MGIFKTKEFARFARKARIDDGALAEAVAAVAAGSWDADLGGGVYKQRIARQGEGKSGGFRTIILFKTGKHSFLVHGFAKNEKANVSSKELMALKALARTLFALDVDGLRTTNAVGVLIEVKDDGKKSKQE